MAPTDFWTSSGYFMLDRDSDGRMRITDDFLRAYFGRPEVCPVEESCPAEIALHERLIEDPRSAVSADDLAAMADPDVRENYDVLLRFRKGLVAHDTLEAYYLALVRDGDIEIPPLFIDQLVHAILRGVLDECEDPLRPRAAELLFRSQKVSVQDGALLLADEEIVEQYAQAGGLSPIAQLLAGTPMNSVELDVLDRNNAKIYWARSDQFDTVLDLTFARPGLDALCRVLESWVDHFLGVEVGIQPVQAISDERWVWHLGLDAESTSILNDLYDDRDVGDDRLARLLSLFRLEFKDNSAVLEHVAGRPVYMGIAMDGDGLVRLKPQNLLLNLPLAQYS